MGGQANCDYAPNPGPWRKWTDMEHSTCYSATNHWSALSDGRMKYIFRAYYGDEQLFNLTSDPEEMVDISGSAAYSDELALWRGRLVKQFEKEGRGDKWVVNGSLVPRKANQAKGPNFPGNHPPFPSPSPPPSPSPSVIAGDLVVMHKRGAGACGSNDCWILQASNSKKTFLKLSGSNLCLSVFNGSALEVQDCSFTGDTGKLQYFTTRNHTSDPTQIAAVLSHVPSGRCVTSVGAGLEPCDEHADKQQWIFGSSGRLCAKYGGQLCLRAMHNKLGEPRLLVV